jgi:hypothetical protein
MCEEMKAACYLKKRIDSARLYCTRTKHQNISVSAVAFTFGLKKQITDVSEVHEQVRREKAGSLCEGCQPKWTKLTATRDERE